MTGLAPQTLKIFSSVASLDCIKQFRLVGGTALSLQINHRLSEDLDFCRWVDSSSAANGIAFNDIGTELNQMFSGVQTNAMSFDQADFRVYGVKITFFNEVGLSLPHHEPIDIGGINCVPVDVLCAMKIKTMFERTVFRDYYDVYSIIKENRVGIEEAINLALAYHSKLRRQNVIRRLTSWRHFRDERSFSLLSPKHEVTSRDIGEYFSDRLRSY